jgi:hypothetical protein
MHCFSLVRLLQRHIGDQKNGSFNRNRNSTASLVSAIEHSPIKNRISSMTADRSLEPFTECENVPQADLTPPYLLKC